MKRFLSAFLALSLLLSMAAGAKGEIIMKNSRATRTGPGTKYSEELGTLEGNTSLRIIAQAEAGSTLWYQVEFTRRGSLYRAYIVAGGLTPEAPVPWENTAPAQDMVSAQTSAWYGPGEHYAARRQKMSAGTQVQVFQVEGDWALCEFRDDWRWARGYIPVACLTYAQPAPAALPPATAAPSPDPAETLPPYDDLFGSGGKICQDYYGNLISWAGRTEDFPALAASLPVLGGLEDVVCVADTPIFTGPGLHYRQVADPGQAFRGILDTNLQVLAQDNGWIMIRYAGDLTGAARYGWTDAAAISPGDLAQVPPAAFSPLPCVLTREAQAADGPGSAAFAGPAFPAASPVTALAFLDARRDWVYCEYMLWEGSALTLARSFFPADSLRAAE